MYWGGLDEVARRRCQGQYANAHLRVPQSLWTAMKGRSARPPVGETVALLSDSSNLLPHLMGIPVVVDASLYDGEWRLVDNSTGVLLRAGQT